MSLFTEHRRIFTRLEAVPTASGSHQLPGFTRKWLFSFPPQIVPVLWLLKKQSPKLKVSWINGQVLCPPA